MALLDLLVVVKAQGPNLGPRAHTIAALGGAWLILPRAIVVPALRRWGRVTRGGAAGEQDPVRVVEKPGC